MNKSVYRNWYYVKESLLDFISCNKKSIIFAAVFLCVGILLGFCVGLNNSSNFTCINLFDKSVYSIFSGGGYFSFCICNILKYLFLLFLVLTLNNFQYLRFLCYALFCYLSFILTVDAIIIISIFSLKGLLFCLLGYLLCNLFLLLTLIAVFVICKTQVGCNMGCSKLFRYPYKTILFIGILALVSILLLGLICKIFCNFIIII